MSQEVDAAAYQTPQSDRERDEMIRAIYLERQRSEGDKLIEALTDRERAILDAAWHAGAQAARSDLQQALHSPHAVTLDASTVRTALLRAGKPLLLRLQRGFPGQHYDDRAVNLVRGVDDMLARLAEYGDRQASETL